MNDEMKNLMMGIAVADIVLWVLFPWAMVAWTLFAMLVLNKKGNKDVQ